jgi:anti-anti-sigma regulatory factor
VVRCPPGPAGLPEVILFTSQSLRAIRSSDLSVKEQRLDDVVHEIAVRGALVPAAAGEVTRRVDAALGGGVRWLIVDLTAASQVADAALPALVAAARELRSRRGELIVAGDTADLGPRFAAWDSSHRPALAANSQQALMILKMLRPKTSIRRDAAARPRSRITSLTLPRIEPT